MPASTCCEFWGGGLYESDHFYELCDEHGIMVWQDFCYACAYYPDTHEYAEASRVEAVAAVRRLRGHASLALWCGNNENQMMFDDGWGGTKPGRHLGASTCMTSSCRRSSPRKTRGSRTGPDRPAAVTMRTHPISATATTGTFGMVSATGSTTPRIRAASPPSSASRALAALPPGTPASTRTIAARTRRPSAGTTRLARGTTRT